MEVWVKIKEFENNFVSNYGRIKVSDRKVKRGDKFVFIKGKIRKQTLTDTGYLVVRLKKGLNAKNYKVHRLVAEAFIENPLNKRTVNHKNGLKTDNRVENLEWATHSENHIHAYRKLGRKKAWEGVESYLCPRSSPVLQYDKNWVFIKKYGSCVEAAIELGISGSHISSVCKGTRKSTGGFFWKKENDLN